MLSLLAGLLLMGGRSYPALLFRESVLTVMRLPLAACSWIPQHFRLVEENRELRQRGVELFVENSRLKELALEGERLQELLGLEQRDDMVYFPSRVIARGNAQALQTVVLDRGLRDGVRGGEALVTPWGLAGTVLEPGLNHSFGILLSHRDFRARVMLQRTREEGLLSGGFAGDLALLDIPLSSDVQVGDPVLTSGRGSKFPPGIPAGTVSRVSETSGLFKEVEVRPLVRLSRLEELFIVQPVPADSVDIQDLLPGGDGVPEAGSSAGAGAAEG